MIINNTKYNELIKRIPLYIEKDDNVRVYKLKIEGELLAWGSDLINSEEVIII